MAILKKDTMRKQVIDLTGPQGNAFYLLGFAIKHCEDFGYDKDDVFAVFDDRNQVVDMWRKNGLTTFQVADGDF